MRTKGPLIHRVVKLEADIDNLISALDAIGKALDSIGNLAERANRDTELLRDA